MDECGIVCWGESVVEFSVDAVDDGGVDVGGSYVCVVAFGSELEVVEDGGGAVE